MTNFQQNRYKNFHHTLNKLLDYLIKCKRTFSVAGSVCESDVLLKDKELSQQLASSTRICNLYASYKDILNKFCDNSNN